MLAVRDQENLVHGQQQVAASKPLNQGIRGLQPKTPGNKYPKTPIRVPLNDENAPTGFGKTVKGKGLEALVSGKSAATFDKDAFITPLGPRNRAPLGMKTTNAKAKGFQTPGPVQQAELEKTQKPQTSNRKPKRVIHADTVKLEVHGDESPLVDRDVEYCPPRPKDLPYESDIFPDGCLDYSLLKHDNPMREAFKQHRQANKSGFIKFERETENAYQKSIKAGEDHILAMMEEEWTIGDVPETFRHLRKKQVSSQDQPKPRVVDQVKRSINMPTKGPATINSRNAASILSATSKSTIALPKASKPAPKLSFLSRPKSIAAPSVPSNASIMRTQAAIATSRSTIGHTKGRSVSGILHTQQQPPVKTQRQALARSISNMSEASDSTITPARFAQKETGREWNSPAFMKAFDRPDDDLDLALGGGLAECLRRADEDEEEFVMTLGTAHGH